MASEEAKRHVPSLDAGHVERIRRWHRRAEAALRARPTERIDYLGLRLTVPAGIFAPTPVSPLLGQAVLEEARATDRVLDMGTGSGVNALLAATRGATVVGVDLNPEAVACAKANAAANGLTDRTTFLVSDVFDAISGVFDLVVFDPPFRWFEPRDLIEAAITDRGYEALGRFFAGVPRHLAPGGRLLVFFGTSGDLDHLVTLARGAGLTVATIAERTLTDDGWTVRYVVLRMTVGP